MQDWFERFAQFIRSASVPTEEETERDGLLSYASEWHALILGFGAGLAAAQLQQPAIVGTVIVAAIGLPVANGLLGRIRGRKAIQELRREPWYAIGGVLIGYAARNVAVALAGLL